MTVHRDGDRSRAREAQRGDAELKTLREAEAERDNRRDTGGRDLGTKRKRWASEGEKADGKRREIQRRES